MERQSITETKFKCTNCGQAVSRSDLIGTQHRNHCPFCLWSKHVDLKKPGDRQSKCLGKMRPIGLTFKLRAPDKYNQSETGELMLAHQCEKCGKIIINRIAGDDSPKEILNVFRKSKKLINELAEKLRQAGIKLVTQNDEGKVLDQLFGNTHDLIS